MIKNIKSSLLKYFKILLITYIIYHIVKYLIYSRQKKIFNIKKISNDDLIHPENAYIFAYIRLNSKDHQNKTIKNLNYNLKRDNKLDYIIKEIKNPKKIDNFESYGHVSYYLEDNNSILFLFQHRYFDGRYTSKIISESITENTNHDEVRKIKRSYIPVLEEFIVLQVLFKYLFHTRSIVKEGIEKFHRFNRFFLINNDEIKSIRDNNQSKTSIAIAWKTLKIAHQFSKKDKLNVLVITSLTSDKIPSNNNLTFFFFESTYSDDYKTFEKKFKKSTYIINTISCLAELGLLHKLGASGKIDVNLSILPPDMVTNDNFVGCSQRQLPISIFTYSNKSKISVSFQINSSDIDPNYVDEVLYSQCPYSDYIEEVENILNIFDDITPYPSNLYNSSIKEKYRIKSMSEKNNVSEINQEDNNKISVNNNIHINIPPEESIKNMHNVKNDEHTNLENDEHIDIENDENTENKGDQHTHIENDEDIEDKGDQSFNQYFEDHRNKINKLENESKNIKETQKNISRNIEEIEIVR